MTEEILTRLRRIEARLTPREPLDEWLTVAQAAELTKFSKDYFYDNADSRPVRYRVGRELRTSRDGLAKWMRSRKTN